MDCHKEDLRRYRDSLVQVHMAGVNVVTGITATADVREYNPDAVIIAIGSEPAGSIRIREYAPAMYAYSDPDKIGKKVVMIGGGLIGVECSTWPRPGLRGQIVEMLDDYARDLYEPPRP